MIFIPLFRAGAISAAASFSRITAWFFERSLVSFDKCSILNRSASNLQTHRVQLSFEALPIQSCPFLS